MIRSLIREKLYTRALTLVSFRSPRTRWIAADCFLGVLDTNAPSGVADATNGLERETGLTLDQVVAGRPYRECVLGMFCTPHPSKRSVFFMCRSPACLLHLQMSRRVPRTASEAITRQDKTTPGRLTPVFPDPDAAQLPWPVLSPMQRRLRRPDRPPRSPRRFDPRPRVPALRSAARVPRERVQPRLHLERGERSDLGRARLHARRVDPGRWTAQAQGRAGRRVRRRHCVPQGLYRVCMNDCGSRTRSVCKVYIHAATEKERLSIASDDGSCSPCAPYCVRMTACECMQRADKGSPHSGG